MKAQIDQILNTYANARKHASFKEHPTADIVRHVFRDATIHAANPPEDRYMLHGSAGQGNWAKVPWLGIFDKEITTTAQEGYYVVYLFSKDMSRVYLALIQGFTWFKNTFGGAQGLLKLRAVSEYWGSELTSGLSDFSTEPINLGPNLSERARGYEAAHILSKKYERGAIPADADLVADLQDLLGVYRELRGKLLRTSPDLNVEEINHHLLANVTVNKRRKRAKRKEHSSKSGKSEGRKTSNLRLDIEVNGRSDAIPTLVGIPDTVYFPEPGSSGLSLKIDFEQSQHQMKRVAIGGENMAMRFERKRLTDAGRADLAAMVEHVSREQGYGAGYDIASFEVDGSPLYIEVKATCDGPEQPFYVTRREVEYSERHPDNYCVYRIYHLASASENPKCYIIKGSLSEKLDLFPTNYQVGWNKRSGLHHT